MRLSGKKVIKHYLKDDAKVSVLVSKANSTIKNRYMEDYDVQGKECPSALSEFLTPIFSKIEQVKTKISSNEGILSSMLDSVDDDKLAKLHAIFKHTSGSYTEEKLVKSCYVLFGEMDILESAVQHCLRAKLELVGAYVIAYATEFHEVKKGDVVFSNSRFKAL